MRKKMWNFSNWKISGNDWNENENIITFRWEDISFSVRLLFSGKKINVKRRVEQRCSLYSFAPTLERARRRGKKNFQGHWLFESLSYALCRCVVTYLLYEKGNKGSWVDGWVSGRTEWDENMNSSSPTGRIDILFLLSLRWLESHCEHDKPYTQYQDL